MIIRYVLKLYFLLGGLLLSESVMAQALVWEKSIGDTEFQWARSFDLTDDGGYILFGHKKIGEFGDRDFWVVKLDELLNQEWEKTFAGSKSEQANFIRQTNDGGYILLGGSNSDDGDIGPSPELGNLWVAKLDSEGAIIWKKIIGGSEDDHPSTIQQTNDGGYIISASTDSSNFGDGNNGSSDCLVIKLNETGEIEWEKTYGGSEHDDATSIRQTIDGGYIVAGGTYSNDFDVSNNYGSKDCWVLKLNELGEIEWEKNFGGTSDEGASDIQQTLDQGYIVVGFSRSNDGDVLENKGVTDLWMFKLNQTGELQWAKSYGGSLWDMASSVQQTIDGGYIVLGTSHSSDGDVSSNHGSVDFWLLKTNTEGEIEWEKNLGSTGNDGGNEVKQKENGNFVVFGTVGSDGGDVSINFGINDCWLAEIDPTLSTLTNPSKSNEDLHILPNPSNGNFTVRLDNVEERVQIYIYDFMGKVKYAKKNQNSLFSIENFPKGIYWLNTISKTGSWTKKMMIH